MLRSARVVAKRGYVASNAAAAQQPFSTDAKQPAAAAKAPTNLANNHQKAGPSISSGGNNKNNAQRQNNNQQQRNKQQQQQQRQNKTNAPAAAATPAAAPAAATPAAPVAAPKPVAPAAAVAAPTPVAAPVKPVVVAAPAAPVAPAPAAAAAASYTPAPVRAAASTPTPVTVGGNGSGNKGGNGGNANNGGAKQPAKGGFVRRLAVRLVVSTGVFGSILYFLSTNVDFRDYADVHAPALMRELRTRLPWLDLPLPSRRASIGQVAVRVGAVETLDQDLANAIKRADAHVDEALKPVREAAGNMDEKVVQPMRQAALDQVDEIVQPMRDAVDRVDEMVQPMRDAVDQAVEKHITPIVVAVTTTTTEVVKPAAAAPAPSTPAPSPSSSSSSYSPRGSVVAPPAAVAQSSAPDLVLAAGATPADIERFELLKLQAQVAAAELALGVFTAAQQKQLWEDVATLEANLKTRGEARLRTLEQSQQFTLDQLSTRQTHALVRNHERRLAPAHAEFAWRMDREEENKWRRKVFLSMEAQNDSMSTVADHWLRVQEKQIRQHYTNFVEKLTNASAALVSGQIKPLEVRLAAHLKQEQRSAEAHKLSAALLALQELVQRDHAPLVGPWKVVSEVARNDYTLRKALEPIETASVNQGVYSLHALKDVFVRLLAPQLKVATFLPDEPSKWTLLRQAAAHLFSFATVNETGTIILPTHAAAAAAASPSAISGASDFAHQATDYAHFINASTYLASNSPELALAELERLQPARRSEQMDAFIRELRKTVQVQQAVSVVKMRVMAINQNPQA